MGITADVIGVKSLVDDFEAMKGAATESTWVVGTNVKYSVYLEFGTSRMPAYPFMRPAVEYVMRNQADAIADHSESVPALVKRLALALERRMKHYASTGVPPGPDVKSGNLRGSIRAEKVA